MTDTIPTDFSDYSHYTLYAERGDDKGVSVYQSRSEGSLFAEDGTPLTYYKGRLIDMEKLARAIIGVCGSDDNLERYLCDAIDRREQFSQVLKALS